MAYNENVGNFKAISGIKPTALPLYQRTQRIHTDYYTGTPITITAVQLTKSAEDTTSMTAMFKQPHYRVTAHAVVASGENIRIRFFVCERCCALLILS